MMKKIPALLLVLILLTASAAANPLPQKEDLSGSYSVPCDENDPSAGTFIYSYTYPQVDEEAEGGAAINAFFANMADYLETFTIPLFMGEDSATTIIFTVTCNNDDYFSVLVKEEKVTPEKTRVRWEGYVFSRKHPDPSSKYTLPKLLGILNAQENEEWVQEHQNEKANETVRGLIWDMIQDNEQEIPFYSDYTEEYLAEDLNPEEDYYLDEDGEPVFYINPGVAAPEESGLLTFPLTLEEIDDEL